MVYWTCVGVETSIPWPSTEKKCVFETQELILRPETATLAPSIAFEHGSKGISASEAQTIIRRFLSALAWIEGLSIKETFSAGGSFPIGIGKSPFRGGGQNTVFDYHYLPTPQEANKKLALALYREALGNNSICYQFLGFVKIINIIAGGRQSHAKWINSHINYVSERRALKKISSLQATNVNIGMHVYESGRCAVAHANIDSQQGPIVDPDSSDDLQRLSEELPLIQALAIIVIEKELGIPSLSTIYKEHVYELKGFKEKLHSNLLKEINDDVMRPILPQEIGMNLSVGIRNKGPYESMNDLQILEAQMNKGVLSLWLSTVEGAVQFPIGLDFKNNCILMNPYAGANILHFGTKQSAISIHGYYQFMKDLFKNGKLQIEIPQTGIVLGYKDAFLPQDIDLKGTIVGLENVIARVEEEIKAYDSCESFVVKDTAFKNQ